MVIITHKTKCNGRKANNTYIYSVVISDGVHILYFYPKTDTDRITFNDLSTGENTLGSRFVFDKNSGKFHKMKYFGTNKNIESQKTELSEFAKKCLNVPIYYYVTDTECIYLYE